MKHKAVARRRGSVIPSLNKRLNISKLEKQQARYEARGRPSPSRLKSDSWLLTSNINAGLSYSERDGISGNVGLNYGLGKEPKTGLSLGMSYNRQDGMGASVGLTSKGGVLRDTGANITRSEYSGFGADISSREYGPGKFSGGLSYNQRDGFTASLNVAGTNALNYNSQTGLSSNTDFISQYSMNRGMSEDSSQTDTEAESRAAQERNNQTQGAQAIEGFGVATSGRRNEGDGSHGVIGFGDDGPAPAHGAPSSHDPGQTLALSGSFDPDGKPTGGRQLSATDVAEFKADWRKESPAQTDASIAGLKAAGYDTSGLEKFVNDYRNAKAANNSQVATTTHPTQSTGFFTNAYNAVVSGASNLWDRVTGGSKPVTHQTAPVFELDNGAKLPFENQGSSYGRVRNLTRNDGTTYTSIPHSGLDQPQASGTPVPVVADGRVIALSRNYENNQNGGGYGAFVLVQHNNGIFTLYGHNSNVFVKVGDSVTRGQVISNVGNSGNSFGAHMHYEVRTGFNVNPRAYISQTTHQNPATFNWNQWIQDHPE
ncbi:M23 family metallopeptidase [Leptospira weilii]|uniref:M23 family metallopeptidase n=2 Tax=Leptospira weilii TaxID=28184 RepID=UPI0002BD4810|nr:M23 family metallopeptidase [Leptospira weilii]EMN44288.1 peptidase, M23 family [Leptospira weilii str. LNT 1234]QDK21637.1 M23 family peptidase [Leptospira weilii]QDK25603.1 M23 family peptidase [Leptospira weilii]